MSFNASIYVKQSDGSRASFQKETFLLFIAKVEAMFKVISAHTL